PLCEMMNKNVKNVRVDRIANLIQEYDIEQVIHIKGRENCLADYLSRYPGVEDDKLNDIEYGLEIMTLRKRTNVQYNENNYDFNSDPGSSSLQLKTARETNSELTEENVENFDNESDDEGEEPIPQIIPKNFSSNHFDITILKTEQQHDPAIQQIIQNLNNHPDSTMKDGIIYKLLNRIHNTGTKTQIVYLPTSMIKPLLYAVRNDSMTGVPPPDGLFQLIGTDLCGPFKRTPRENQYALVLTDHFTRHVTALALPDCTAQTTASTLFNDYFCKFGISLVILSDQGPHFQNMLMQNISKLIGYNHIYSTPYHPQTNGIVERFNATFVPQLAKLQDSEDNNWDE
ncbi:unnamed protein product, partial [Didymodactylos carnosus]